MKIRRILIAITASLVLLCIGLILVSYLSNRLAPSRSQVTDRLGDQDKARLLEALHLKQALGNTLWPGWAETDIPLIAYNEEYAFLVRYENPAAGWTKVPQNLARGGRWEPVPEDTFDGQVYYRQRLEPGVTPESFTVLVGNRWVASLATREWFQIALGNPLRRDFGPLFPYRLAAQWLAGSSDKYITLVLHESFHAYQGVTVPERLARAEGILTRAKECHWEDPALQAAWQKELDLLAQAVMAKEDGAARKLARDFLAQRDTRRSNGHISPTCIELEQQREWLEGLAKYTELTMWRQAGRSKDYQPLPILHTDADFNNYGESEQRWSQEVGQIKPMGGQLDDNSFYYSGMAQAALLDRLMPGWQTRILTDHTRLEDLLREIAIR